MSYSYSESLFVEKQVEIGLRHGSLACISPVGQLVLVLIIGLLLTSLGCLTPIASVVSLSVGLVFRSHQPALLFVSQCLQRDFRLQDFLCSVTCSLCFPPIVSNGETGIEPSHTDQSHTAHHRRNSSRQAIIHSTLSLRLTAETIIVEVVAEGGGHLPLAKLFLE